MNLTDLRDELTTHADDLGTAPDLRPASPPGSRRRSAAARSPQSVPTVPTSCDASEACG